MKTKQLIIFLIGSCLFGAAYGQSCLDLLPQVSLQLTADQWVTTQTSKVTVAMDALLNKDQLAKAQGNFQAGLNKIASGIEWHITEFSRTGSKANLEQIHAVAEARLPETALAGIRERAKSLSMEGQTYTIQDIIYSPSVDEISAVTAKLRSQIYTQAKAELGRLNAVFPQPNYSLYSINFVGATAQLTPTYMAKTSSTMNLSATREQPSMAVSQQMTQDALVIFAAPSAAFCSSQDRK